MAGWAASMIFAENMPVPCFLNRPPTRAVYRALLRKHVRRAVDGDDALAALDEIEQGRLVLRRQVAGVAEDHQGVVLRQRLRRQLGDVDGERRVDAVFGQRVADDLGELVRPVVAAVAEEQELQARLVAAGPRRMRRRVREGAGRHRRGGAWERSSASGLLPCETNSPRPPRQPCWSNGFVTRGITRRLSSRLNRSRASPSTDRAELLNTTTHKPVCGTKPAKLR